MRPRHADIAIATCIMVLPWFQEADAASRWPEQRTAGPFVCRADFDLRPYEPMLAELALLQHDLHRDLGVTPAREPIHLYLFARREDYQRALQKYFPGFGFRRAIYGKTGRTAIVLAYRQDSLANDVRHEGTHALLHASMPVVPLWLDEGIASYFELPRPDRATKNPYFGKIRWATRLGTFPSISELESIRKLGDMGDAEYRYAWAWVHYMLHGSTDARETLLAFLADLQAHTPPGQLSERLRRRLPELDRDVVRHFRNWKPT